VVVVTGFVVKVEYVIGTPMIGLRGSKNESWIPCRLATDDESAGKLKIGQILTVKGKGNLDNGREIVGLEECEIVK
jgi:hypothetical protein